MKRIFQVSSAILPFKPNTKVPPTLIAGPWKRYFAGRWGGARLSFIRRSEAIWRVRNGERLWNQVTWGKAGSPEHFRLDERSHTGDLLFVSNNLEGSLMTQGSDISMTAKGRNRTRTNQKKKKRRTVSHFIISSSSKKEGMNRGWSVSHHRENTSRVSSCQKYSIKSKYEKVLGNL